MLPGVSTACFYPQYTEVSLRQLASIPVAAAEVFVNCIDEIAPSYCRELRAIAEGGGTRIVSLHPYTSGMEPMYFFSEYDRRYREGFQLYQRFFEAAAIMGATVVVFHGNIRQSEMSCEEYCERYGRLVAEAKRWQIELCHENVIRCMSYRPDFFAAIQRFLPEAKFVLDVKQAVRAGFHPLSFVEIMKKNVHHIHISGNDSDHDCLVPGRGTFNIGEFLSQAGKHGFSGSVIVEVYRENFRGFVEIEAGYQHLLQQISTQRKSG